MPTVGEEEARFWKASQTVGKIVLQKICEIIEGHLAISQHDDFIEKLLIKEVRFEVTEILGGGFQLLLQERHVRIPRHAGDQRKAPASIFSSQANKI